MGKVSINGVTIEVPDGATISFKDNTFSVNGNDIQVGEISKKVEIDLKGTVANLQVHKADVKVNGNVTGEMRVDGNVSVTGNTGFVNADGNTTVEGDVHGNVIADGNVTVKGTVTGSVSADGNVVCGNVGGNVKADGSVVCKKY